MTATSEGYTMREIDVVRMRVADWRDGVISAEELARAVMVALCTGGVHVGCPDTGEVIRFDK